MQKLLQFQRYHFLLNLYHFLKSFRDVDLTVLLEQKFEIDLDSEEGKNVTVSMLYEIRECVAKYKYHIHEWKFTKAVCTCRHTVFVAVDCFHVKATMLVYHALPSSAAYQTI